MNRQVRRIEEKKEKKAEREKAKAKAERAARRQQRRKGRREAVSSRAGGDAAPDGGPKKSGPRTTNPGRFSGVLMAATVFFIALQTVAPSDGTLAGQAVGASFYLLFGYFATLWMMRRSSPRPILVAVSAGAMMTLATLASQAFQSSLEIAPVMLALAIPATVAGAFLGRLVWNRAP